MRIGVIGINQKLADVALREALAQACHSHFSTRFPSILLFTCNRMEIYFWGPDLAAQQSAVLAVLRRGISDPFEHLLYSYFAFDCFHHLAMVTAGLDSAILGETGIQGQVKQAYETARSRKRLPSEVHYLFQKCLAIGKRLRSTLSLQTGGVDLESEVAQLTYDHLGTWNKKRVLVVGASDVGVRVMAKLRGHGASDLWLCNRTCKRAEQIAHRQGARILPWRKLSAWLGYHAVIFGTKAPHPLIWGSEWRSGQTCRLLIDLSVPRNVDPAIGRYCSLVNIDAVDRRVAGKRAIHYADFDAATSAIFQAVQRHVALWKQKETIAPLRQKIA